MRRIEQRLNTLERVITKQGASILAEHRLRLALAEAESESERWAIWQTAAERGLEFNIIVDR